MPLLAPISASREIKLPEAGMCFGRCVAVIDLGTHVNERFKTQGGKSKRNHMVQIQFELPTQMMEFEGQQRPMMATKRYTLSSHEKAILRLHMESWYGKKFDSRELEAKGGFDLEKILGRPALLNLAHSPDGKYCNIISINPPMKGSPEPPQINQNRLFSLGNPEASIWDTLSQKTQEFIRQSEEAVAGRVFLPADPVKAEKAPSDASEVPF